MLRRKLLQGLLALGLVAPVVGAARPKKTRRWKMIDFGGVAPTMVENLPKILEGEPLEVAKKYCHPIQRYWTPANGTMTEVSVPLANYKLTVQADRGVMADGSPCVMDCQIQLECGPERFWLDLVEME